MRCDNLASVMSQGVVTGKGLHEDIILSNEVYFKVYIYNFLSNAVNISFRIGVHYEDFFTQLSLCTNEPFFMYTVLGINWSKLCYIIVATCSKHDLQSH